VEFKQEMSKTRLWWFNFGISGIYGNVNEGWDESSVVHRIPTDFSPYRFLIERRSADLEVGSSG